MKQKTNQLSGWLLGLAVLLGGALAVHAVPPDIRQATGGRNSSKFGGVSGRVSGGSCTTNVDCDDDNGCTVDMCTDNVCVHIPIPKCRPECALDEECSDDDFCTTDMCVDSFCEYVEIPGCTPACDTDADCDDGNACTIDDCPADVGVCNHEEIPGCVPCGSDTTTTASVDVVVVFDTSGSLQDEAQTLCNGIGSLIADLDDLGIPATFSIIGITEVPAFGFPCLSDHVVNMLGDSVPVITTAFCPFPEGFASNESWGPATAIVANEFPWTPNAVRIVVPISDEGACNGTTPGGCNDPGDDRDTVMNAAAVAVMRDVIVSPIVAAGADPCVSGLADDLAQATNGMMFSSQNAGLDLMNGLRNIVLAASGSITTAGPDQDECDDGNLCTTDTCVDGVCANDPNFDMEVDCCAPATGDLTTIDDGDPCTADVCDPETGDVSHDPGPSGESCDDGDACTEADMCDGQGNCVGTPISCDDGDLCTDDTCDDGVCDHVRNFNIEVECCDPQTGNTVPNDDGDPCTIDSCDPETGVVIHDPAKDGTTCDDGDACTDDLCSQGTCEGTPNFDEELFCCDPADGELAELDDGNDCTEDLCDRQTGVVTHPPSEANMACDDGDACTAPDRCNGQGVCVGVPVDCDDSNPCTDDTCVDGACQNVRNYNIEVECCDPQTGETVPNDDGNACTIDSCNPETGVVNHTPAPNGTDCDDDNACTDDMCTDGECAGTANHDEQTQCCDPETGGLTPIDDGITCTEDLCDRQTGMVTHPPSEANMPCDDGDGCTGPDVCDGQGGCSGPPIDCDDNDVCTDDACEGGECVHTPNYDTMAFCCDPETGDLLDIDDGDPCTIDICDPDTGLVSHPPRGEGASCDDGNPCTDDTCQQGQCVGVLNYDDAVECCDPMTGTYVPVDDGDSCTTDVCDVETGMVDHTPAPNGMACDDGDACTDDMCMDGVCTGTPNYNTMIVCCDPMDGSLTLLDDGNPCTEDLCDPMTGMVAHPPAEQGMPCDDGTRCTIDDVCNGQGFCMGTDINTIACDNDNDCFGNECNTQIGLCECLPRLCLIADPEDPMDTGCHAVGEELLVLVHLEFGSSAEVTGGQFVIPYDPSVLNFIDVVPGSEYDPSSPYEFEIFRSIDEVNGRIIYSVAAQPGGQGTRGPAVMAAITFEPIDSCAREELCFVNQNPANTLLTGPNGDNMPFEPCCTGEMLFDDGEPVIDCPPDTAVNPTPGYLTADVTWDPVTVDDACDGGTTLACTATHSSGVNIDHLIETGGEFPAGVSEFSCTASDACGHMATCEWEVVVSNTNTAELTVQLSPTMVAGPLRRCLELQLFSSCAEPPVTFTQTLSFGLPFDLPGRVKDRLVKIPAGQYVCATARDPLHTLRAVAMPDVVDDRYIMIWKGDPFFGGNWLTGGNLDGNRHIDVMDVMVFMEQEQSQIAADTPCGTESPHADLNGDGIVNQLDWSIIQANYLRSDKGACCPSNVSAGPDPVTSVTTKELRLRGLDHLTIADLNNDGYVNEADMQLYTEGVRPMARGKNVHKLETRRK